MGIFDSPVNRGIGYGLPGGVPAQPSAYGILGQQAGWGPQLGLLGAALADAGANFSGHPADANHLNQQILLSRQLQAQQALQQTPFNGDAQGYLASLMRAGVPAETAIQAASGMRGLQGYKTLSAQDAAALGYRPGSVVQQGPDNSLHTEQTSDLLSNDAVNQQLGIKRQEGQIAAEAPITKYQNAQLVVQRDQLNKPVSVGFGDTLIQPLTGKVVYGGGLSTSANVATGKDGQPLNGDAFLATIPAQYRNQVKALGEYRQAPLTSMALRSPQGAMLSSWVNQAYPGYDASQYGAKTKARADFVNGPDGRSLTAIDTSVQHLSNLGQLAQALGNGNIQAFNSLGQSFAQQTGSPVPTNFDALKQIVGDEIVKALIGTGGAQGDRDAAKSAISRASSPQQLAGAIDTYQKALAGKLGPLRQKYQYNTKLKDFNDMITPETASVLGALPQGGAAGTIQPQVTLPQNPGGQKIRVYNPATGKLE